MPEPTTTNYATSADIIAVGRSLTTTEQSVAEILITQASAKLRLTARKYGKDIDAMIADSDYGADYALAVKNAVVQAVIRSLNSVSEAAAVSQMSQSALGYSATVSYVNAGQSLYFLRNELKDLGILRQTYGALEVYGSDSAD